MESSEHFFNQVLEAIEFNKIKLPTQPEIAVKIRETAEDPNVTVPDMAEIITKDPALTARIIRVANSPLMRGVVEIDSVANAIGRLGLNFVCNLAIGLAMEQIFMATNEQVDLWTREVWDHSVKVAAISHVLAAEYTKIPADQATLIGLLHGIGTLPILTFAEEHDELLEDTDKLKLLIQENHPRLGKAILKAWQFPEDYAEVPDQYVNLSRDVSDVDFIDLVQIANAYVPYSFTENYFNEDRSGIKAFERIGFESDFDIMNNGTLKPKIDEAIKLFS